MIASSYMSVLNANSPLQVEPIHNQKIKSKSFGRDWGVSGTDFLLGAIAGGAILRTARGLRGFSRPIVNRGLLMFARRPTSVYDLNPRYAAAIMESQFAHQTSENFSLYAIEYLKNKRISQKNIRGDLREQVVYLTRKNPLPEDVAFIRDGGWQRM
ncbi:MAG: hypothetical protein ACOYK9_06000 [Chlamydiia bacterium]